VRHQARRLVNDNGAVAAEGEEVVVDPHLTEKEDRPRRDTDLLWSFAGLMD
jgi:hypothetical protein